VDLVLGPTSLPPPSGARVERVTTALEMERATLAHAADATIAIATAAVADWRPAETHASKVKKTDAAQALRLERNPDILAALGARKNGTFLVGFAAETDAHEANAREKLVRKHLDAIAVNDVSGERGFGGGDSALTVLWGTAGRRALPSASKRVLAGGLWDTIVSIRRETPA
jgi:phosphopantothenoylcysteine decarboxylase/phosphopantothenate--cysteine ligase